MGPELVSKWCCQAMFPTNILWLCGVFVIGLIFLRKTSFATWLATSAAIIIAVEMVFILNEAFFTTLRTIPTAPPANQLNALGVIQRGGLSLYTIGGCLMYVAIGLGFLERRRTHDRLKALMDADAPVEGPRTATSTTPGG